MSIGIPSLPWGRGQGEGVGPVHGNATLNMYKGERVECEGEFRLHEGAPLNFAICPAEEEAENFDKWRTKCRDKV